MEAPSIPPTSLPPPTQEFPKTRRFSKTAITIILIALIVGASIGFAVTYLVLNGRIDTLQSQLNSGVKGGTFISYPNATYFVDDNISLSTLYQLVKGSVVVIQDLVPAYNLFGQLAGYSLQQGSGFIASVNDQLVIVTNNHVIQDAINVTVTFADGSSYPAKVLGGDPLADLAVLSITPMPNGLTPLKSVTSDNLKVGQPVVAVGSPYGLSGTLTTGVISSLGRTITESDGSSSSGPTIPDIIQTSTAINPGNSGGPLLDYSGNVVGITTAAVSSSQSLGFAIPSDTINRELSSLVSSGSYNSHPSIGTTGTDMNYQIAQTIGTSTTYGYLVESVSSQNGLKGGNTKASILGSTVTLGGDIITAIDGARITNTDDLLSYLEEHTLPGQTAQFTIVRGGQTQTITVTIEKVS
jgi:S1-C subfamily serine protease